MRGRALLALALLVSNARADEPVPDAEASTESQPGRADADLEGETNLRPDDEFGPVLLIEAIHITGNRATQEEIIRRALPIAPGDVLHASDKRLRNARFKVLALGFFRDVTFGMRKGSRRGHVIIEVDVVERGTFVLNKLWFGHTPVAPYWFGTDVGDRNLLGLGISMAGAAIYAAPGDIEGSRGQWAGELRLADGSLLGTRWGAGGSLTLVHGSDIYRVSGTDDNIAPEHFRAFPYRRFGGRFGVTYDITALARLSAQARIEGVTSELPAAPTRELPDGRIVGIDLHLEPGASRIVTVGIGFDRDTRSDPILPHAGGRLSAAVEIGTSGIASDYDFATLFGRYEHWWPLRDERHAIGMRLAGVVVVGSAPRFDRIYISDVNRMLTPRPLGLVLSNATPLDILTTRDDKPAYGEIGGLATIEYVLRLFRGPGPKRVYGGDLFIATGLWGLAETVDFQLRDTSLWSALPVDLFIDTGLRIDTDVGIFELTFSNALGRLR